MGNRADVKKEGSASTQPSREEEFDRLLNGVDPRLARSFDSMVALEESYFASASAYSPPQTATVSSEID